MSGVYIIEFDIYPGLYKIGKSKDIDMRFKQYKNNTIVLGEVRLLYSKEFEDYSKAEKDIHNLLKDYRVKDNREFFKGDINKLIKTIESLDSNNYKIIKDISPDPIYLESFETGDLLKQLEDVQYKCDNLYEMLEIILQIIEKTIEKIDKLTKILIDNNIVV